MNAIERFWSKVDKRGPDECWNWTAGKTKGDYGVFWYSKAQVRATRFLLEVIKGIDIVDKLVCHTCDNTKCVNPDHLFIGSDKDNMEDRDSKLRMVHGERVHTAKVTEDDVLEIRRLATTSITHREIADMFGLSRPQTSNIIRRQTWKHI